MNVQIWESPARMNAICRAAHGTQVELLAVQRDTKEERFYFRVKTPNCEGWLPEAFLSPKKNAPVGDRQR